MSAEIDEERDEERKQASLTTEEGKERAESGGVEQTAGRSYRKPALAVARAIVVLAIAGVGYAVVIPTHHDRQTKVVTSRLAELTIPKTGLAGFKTKAANAGVQTASNAGISALTTAAKQDPGQTGLYVKDWTATAKGSNDEVGLIVFLLPTSAKAQTVATQVAKMELAASAQSASGLVRKSTFTVPGVAGSSGSIFAPKKPTKTSQDLAVSIFREGRVVSFIQAAKTTTTTAGANEARDSVVSVSKAQAAQAQKVGPGFDMVQLVRPAGTSYPTVASIVWIAGSVVVALLAAVGPILFGRARRRRRERLQAELDRMIVVRGQTITKRRAPGSGAQGSGGTGRR